MTLSDLFGHSPVASLFRCDFSHSCTTVNRFDCHRASRGASVIAEGFLYHVSDVVYVIRFA